MFEPVINDQIVIIETKKWQNWEFYLCQINIAKWDGSVLKTNGKAPNSKAFLEQTYLS